MPLFSPEHWKLLDIDGMVDQENPAIVFYCEVGMQFVFTSNIDKWLEMWKFVNSQIEQYQAAGCGTVFVCLRSDHRITVNPIPPTLADIRLEGETDDIQPS